jgi:hypothetical protein
MEAARYFIDQLEMLTVKTKGNLSKEEDTLLKQSLMTARMAFVETANSGRSTPGPAGTEMPKPEAAPAEPPPGETASAPAPEAASTEDGKKKFVKKY